MGYSPHVVLVTINQQEYFGFAVSFGMHLDAGAFVHMHRTIPSKVIVVRLRLVLIRLRNVTTPVRVGLTR